MTDTLSSIGGLFTGSSGTQSGNTTPSDFTGLSGGSPSLSDLSSLISPSVADTLTGGNAATSSTSPGYDPALYTPGGPYSATGTSAQFASDPQIAQAQQDPSGQIPETQQKEQQPDQGSQPQQPQQQQQQQQQPTTTGQGGDQGGGFGLGGQQQQQQSPLAQIAKLIMGGQGGTKVGAPSAATAQPAAPAPAEPAAPAAAPPAPAAASAPATPQSQPSAGGGGAPAPQPGGPPGMGAAPGGLPGLIQSIMQALGLGGLIPPQLQNVAQQAYPQRQLNPQFNPMAPTRGLGPYARARAGRPGQYAQPSQDEWNRNTQYGGGLGPAPGNTDQVSAPTQQQVQQTRLMGSDTPPTEGFSPVLERERSKFRDQLNDPRTKWETLAMISMEHGNDPAAVAESLMNRCDFAKTDIRRMLHSGFYGPINFGRLGREVRRLQANPQLAAKLNAGLETALRGSNLIGGATDQGSFGGGQRRDDPNVHHTGGRVSRFGEIYNDWGGGAGHEAAAAWRKAQQQRVRAGMAQTERGQKFAMDITRRVPLGGGAEMEGGGMMRRGAPTTEYENMIEQRERRERDRVRARAGMLS